MSSFPRGGGGGESGAAEETGAAASAINFFRRVKDIVVRPVPGLISATSSSQTRTAGGGTKAAAAGGGEGGGGKAAAGSGGGKKLSSASSSSTGSGTKVPSSGGARGTGGSAAAAVSYRRGQYDQLMESDNIDLTQLRKLSWNGIPAELRPLIWQLMLGYLPTNSGRREQAIERKRREYLESIPLYYDTSLDGTEVADRTTHEGEIMRQILVDLPRTSPDLPFFQQGPIQKMMERILYIWSIRHPASGYVQGMNDLLTPLLLVAMQPYCIDKSNAMRCDVATISATTLGEVEADAYWMLTKLLDNIQDHYTFSQPGLQRMVLRLEDIMRRHSPDLDEHFQEEGIQYMQFAFRWMNCLLLRELPLKAILRLWDTYLAEDRAGFENFHVYVCAVFLKEHEKKLMEMSFQDILMFLQDLPTGEWGEEDVEPILSQAFILSTLYDGSASHLA